MSAEDFFDDALDDAYAWPPRDRYGRPLIEPAGGGKPIAYTRASTLSDFMDGGGQGLRIWSERFLAKGMADRPDLAAMAAAAAPLTGDKEQDRASHAILDPVIEQAKEYAGVHRAANFGTAVHKATEPDFAGVVPDALAADREAFIRELNRYRATVLGTEVFVVNDRLQAAGTFDHLIDLPPFGPTILDKKTGKVKLAEAMIQTAVYAGGEVYQEGDEHPDRLSITESCLETLNTEFAILAHLPLGKGECTFYVLDLEAGRMMADACALKRNFSRKGERTTLHEAMREVAGARMAEITRKEEASAIYRDFSAVWDDALTAMGKSRIAKFAQSE